MLLKLTCYTLIKFILEFEHCKCWKKRGWAYSRGGPNVKVIPGIIILPENMIVT